MEMIFPAPSNIDWMCHVLLTCHPLSYLLLYWSSSLKHFTPLSGLLHVTVTVSSFQKKVTFSGRLGFTKEKREKKKTCNSLLKISILKLTPSISPCFPRGAKWLFLLCDALLHLTSLLNVRMYHYDITRHWRRHV